MVNVNAKIVNRSSET